MTDSPSIQHAPARTFIHHPKCTKPAEFRTCLCGHRRLCAMCGWGTGGFPCQTCEVKARA